VPSGGGIPGVDDRDPTGLNVTVLSIDGHMDFGVVANAAVLADAFELAHACETAFAQLLRASRRAPRRRCAGRSRAGGVRCASALDLEETAAAQAVAYPAHAASQRS